MGKNSEEKAKKAMVDAARLADELRAEQEHAQYQEKLRKELESHIKELQVRVDEAEAAALKGGKKTIAKLKPEYVNSKENSMVNRGDTQKPRRTSVNQKEGSRSCPSKLKKTARTTNVCKILLTNYNRRSRHTRGRSKKPKKLPPSILPNSAKHNKN